ncbi:hypothetical protein K491DRAFT_689578 [Lophiostoma macrostomum CBS 122681]|uniref:Uncharacterized protein n=1 Tax=Lophiostoma macrostomum CBS 122681 TaxID=1314788 RepID=A0A6A6TG75_9PLEO|nr:hypothetical protein K491DRAFT_689578 [Lophiostoma macrostomum CBS 122681]
MTRTNFTECGNTYMNDPDLIRRYNYSGPVKLIAPNPLTQITYEGCIALCGHGNQWYPWSTTAATITTWVLPIVGTLLQAPFESNAFWRTIKAINRWVGNPISSLAFILWDIEISGKCALFVDMALPYEDSIPDENSDYASLRDSFYLLMNLTQYKMKRVISMTREAEGLLRIMLFSKDLELHGTRKSLGQMRRKLAYDLRCNRRRGVVPVFISTLWFLVSLSISIEAAFNDVGSNTQAHSLAIGLFMAWFPVLILCSILDRNPVASDDIQRKLNKMVDLVCVSLQDDNTRNEYVASFQDLPQAQQMAVWVEKITAKAPYIERSYFCGFSGQARTRFHYGAGHAILVDIEKAYIADRGRGWLTNTKEARAALVLGQVDRGFVWFDGRQLWQIMASITLVGGTSAGAFVLSFFTPTVGLGCRTGGHMVFFIIAFSLHLAELGVWWFTSPLRRKDQFRSQVQELIHNRSEDLLEKHNHLSLPGLAASRATLAKILSYFEEFMVWSVLLWIRVLPLEAKIVKLSTTERAIRNHFVSLHRLTTRAWLQRGLFTPLEFANTVWLCYLIIAQTLGAFNNCACMTSIWGGSGGYMDFTQYNHANSTTVVRYWIEGTVTTCFFMALGMGYIVLEWLLQSHLSTENYHDAAKGLKRVRRFKRFTSWIRIPSTLLVLVIDNFLSACKLRKTSERKVLVWSKNGMGASMIDVDAKESFDNTVV